jgi:4-amino-4-deoxy-L-arabinose transferase-like glycosyltransferase
MIRHPLFAAFILLSALMLTVDMTRPLMPVDETRYLTVAWEYFVRGEWILPTLNYDPYHHKPPFLFWFINGMWTITGTTSLWAARIVTLFASFGTLFLTYRIAKRLWPHDKKVAGTAVYMMLATPFFLIYSSLIMFDTLLTLAVLMGIHALICFYQTGNRWYFITLGLAFGLGGLIKGPVIILHLLPLILLFPLFQRPFAGPGSIWFQGSIFALVIGIAITLAWAIPAAIEGGPEYEKMIFWGQSAGRMVKAFDHAHPFWFYLIWLPVLFIPWVFIFPVYRSTFSKSAHQNIGNQKAEPFLSTSHPLPSNPSPTRFILCWIMPVFIAFMAISGKQIHYLIPLLPGAFMLLAHIFIRTNLQARLSAPSLFLILTGPVAILILAFIGLEFYADEVNSSLTSGLIEQLKSAHPIYLYIAAAFLGGIYITLKRLPTARLSHPLLLGAAMNIGMIMALHASLSPMLYRYYDLSPLAAQVKKAEGEGRPIAIGVDWEGELGYLAHMKKPILQIKEDQIRSWLRANPKGIILHRHRKDAPQRGVKILFSQEYRSPGKRFSVLGK